MKLIPIIIFSALFILVSSTVQAITNQRAKECLLCHVLWFNPFKTEQKTLVEKKDSSIVIAGSMGLASSKEMCMTCHDGYVVDSRNNLVQGNPHFMLKKPPDGFKIPENFRLDMNNEIYCGTCHTLHDITGTGEVGSTAFMRMDNEKSQMCIACHGDKTEPPGSTHHAAAQRKQGVHRAGSKGPAIGSAGAGTTGCRSCHRAHGEHGIVPRFRMPARFHEFNSGR